MLTTCCRREPCAEIREGISEVSVAVRIAAMIEHRKLISPECRDCQNGRRQHRMFCYGEVRTSSAVSEEFRDVHRPTQGLWEGFTRPWKKSFFDNAAEREEDFQGWRKFQTGACMLESLFLFVRITILTSKKTVLTKMRHQDDFHFEA